MKGVDKCSCRSCVALLGIEMRPIFVISKNTLGRYIPTIKLLSLKKHSSESRLVMR